jgi:hypothetical protein
MEEFVSYCQIDRSNSKAIKQGRAKRQTTAAIGLDFLAVRSFGKCRCRERPVCRSGSHRAGDGTRTHDLHVGNVSLYQLSYTRVLVLTILPVLPPL